MDDVMSYHYYHTQGMGSHTLPCLSLSEVVPCCDDCATADGPWLAVGGSYNGRSWGIASTKDAGKLPWLPPHCPNSHWSFTLLRMQILSPACQVRAAQYTLVCGRSPFSTADTMHMHTRTHTSHTHRYKTHTHTLIETTHTHTH